MFLRTQLSPVLATLALRVGGGTLVGSTSHC
jgi:hypothetical protein